VTVKRQDTDRHIADWQCTISTLCTSKPQLYRGWVFQTQTTPWGGGDPFPPADSQSAK